VDLVGTLLITGGLVFIAYGVFSLGRQLSPLPAPRRNHKLVTTGMYGEFQRPALPPLPLPTCHTAAPKLVAWAVRRCTARRGGRPPVLDGPPRPTRTRGPRPSAAPCRGRLRTHRVQRIGPAKPSHCCWRAGYVRHPMYGGLLCAGLGLAIVSRNECRLALTALLWLVLDRKVGRVGA